MTVQAALCWLHPTSSLAGSKQYTATVKSGSGGATDVAGNALAADRIRSFTTNGAPTASISQPASTLKFKVGDIITYSGSATDPEEGTLSGTSLAWTIVLFHCPGTDCHTHPFLSSTGAGASSRRTTTTGTIWRSRSAPPTARG